MPSAIQKMLLPIVVCGAMGSFWLTTAQPPASKLPIRPGDPAWPVAWVSYRTVESLDKDIGDMKAHGVGLMSVRSRDVAGARKMLETARRTGIKYAIELPEVTEESQVVRDAGLEPVDALMIGGVYGGKAIDRHLFRFSAGKHEIIVEQPVYDKGFAYTMGSRGTGRPAPGSR